MIANKAIILRCDSLFVKETLHQTLMNKNLYNCIADRYDLNLYLIKTCTFFHIKVMLLFFFALSFRF